MLHPGFAIWITGLPSSGKSTLAARVAKKLAEKDIHTQVLESDVMRDLLVPGLGYGAHEREIFYHLLIAVGELLMRNGVNVIFDATATQRRFREEARQRLDKFMEVYVNTPLEECERRDPKRIYERGRQGIIKNVPGIQEPYEPPLEPEVTVDTTTNEPEQEAEAVLAALQKMGFIEKN